MLAIASTSENATRAEHATQAAYEVGHGKMRTSSSSVRLSENKKMLIRGKT
jgi:hypothetical protein